MPENSDMKSLPTVHELTERASAGHQFTREEVRNLAAAEMATTGAPGPIFNGPAATAQAIYDAQQHSADEAEEAGVHETNSLEASCVTLKHF